MLDNDEFNFYNVRCQLECALCNFTLFRTKIYFLCVSRAGTAHWKLREFYYLIKINEGLNNMKYLYKIYLRYLAVLIKITEFT